MKPGSAFATKRAILPAFVSISISQEILFQPGRMDTLAIVLSVFQRLIGFPNRGLRGNLAMRMFH